MWISVASVFANVSGNASVEISVEIINSGDGKVAGLGWADNGVTGSAFAVMPYRGYFNIWKDNQGTAPTVYKDYTVNDAVSKTVNVLKLAKLNGTFHFSVNGIEVFNMPVGAQPLDRSGFVIGPGTMMNVYYYKAMQLL
jgi:hypothetical protein